MGFLTLAFLGFRPHQSECVKALLTNPLRMAYAQVTVAGGKSHILGECARIGMTKTRVLTLAHTRELVEQDIKACTEIGIYAAPCSHQIGINLHAQVTVGTIGSVINRLQWFSDVGLLLIDEGHRVPLNDKSQYRRLINALPNAMIRTVTGTDYRMDGSGSMEDSFGPCVYRYGFAAALGDGYVKPLRAVEASADSIETKGLKVNSNGEWGGSELRNRGVALAPVHAAAAIVAMNEEGRRRIIVFACDIEHADALGLELRKRAGAVAVVHSGKTSDPRVSSIRAFRQGMVRWLVSVDMFGTGFDVADIDGEVLARPWRSRLAYEQGLGRGARITELAVDCAVVDFGGNIARHGPIDMVHVPKINKERAAREDKIDDIEKNKEEVEERQVGKDLRQGANAERQILSDVRIAARWVAVTGVVEVSERGRVSIGTAAGRALWGSAKTERLGSATHAFVEYKNGRGLIASGVRDGVGMVWQAV